MKFQRRILPPHSPTYLEMEEYTTPSSSHQSISIAGSISDLSDIGSVYCLATIARQKSDSLTNLFHMSDDNTSLSNLSIASYSLSQHSCDNGTYPTPTNPTISTSLTVSSPTTQIPIPNGSDKISRKQYSSSYKNLTEEPSSPVSSRQINANYHSNSRRSGDSTRFHHFTSTNLSGSSSTTSSQKSFPIKTAETVLNTIGLNKSSSNNDLTDKSGLIANDGNDVDNTDDDDDDQQQSHHSYRYRIHPYDDVQSYCDNPYVDSSDENELDMISSRNSAGTSQNGRGLRKTVLNNVDRFLNTTNNKQMKL